MNAPDLVRAAAAALDSKKGRRISAIDIHSLSVLADYFVIASGSSSTQVHALADEVEFQLAQQGIQPNRVEGIGNDSWMLLDYGTVIVHIFLDQAREFYDLERLWQDGTEFPLTDVLHPD